MKFRYKYIFKAFWLVLIVCGTAAADNYPRNTAIDIQHYTFKIAINDSTDCITGETDIEIKFLKKGTGKFSLDLDGLDSITHKGMSVSRVFQNGKSIAFRQQAEKLEIDLASTPAVNSIKEFAIFYSGVPSDGLIISKNKYGDRTFFGDNWPDRAHCWLPTVDHPYDKATCDFIITAPSEYKVIANGKFVDEKKSGAGFCVTHWRESVPISTKVMVFGAAKFAVQYFNGKGSVPVESWAYQQDSKIGFYDLRPAKDILEYFTSLIGPFPYEKLANVESKTIYGGMENASAIFYAEEEITGTRRSLVTVAHEIAHQWFGDAVTEADWAHIWLSEGFATFFQNVFVEHQFGRDSLINCLRLEEKQVIKYDSLNPGQAVVDTAVSRLTDLLNANSYQKGGWILRMLQHVIGNEAFWKGIRLYYKTYRDKNALTSNFEKIMEIVSGRSLKWFFNEWLYKPGLPYINCKWDYDEKAGMISIIINQEQPGSNLFKMPLDLRIYYDGERTAVNKKIEFNSRTNTYKFRLKHKPIKIIPDPDTWLLMKSELSEY